MHSEETKVYITVLIGASILGLILIFFIVTMVLQQIKTNRLHKEKVSAEIITLENERKRVASDLHDEVAVLLSIAKLELSALDIADTVQNQLLDKAITHIDDGLSKIQFITRDLMPIALTRQGLFHALRELFDSINNATGIKINYTFPEATIDVPSTMQIHIYRIVQEMLHNTLKHANASILVYEFKEEEKMFCIKVLDNGSGFNKEHVSRNYGGLGLHNIMSRVEMMDGNLYLETAEGKGVQYTIEIPRIHAI